MKLSIKLKNPKKVIKISIISRYLLRQFLGPLAIGSLFFTFIIMVFYLKEVIRLAIEKNLGFFLIFELMFYSLGWTVSMTIPMAALLSTIMTIGRLNQESELIAMRSGGASFMQLFRPFFLFGLGTTLVMFFYSHIVIPFCFYQMATAINTINRSDPIAILTPGQFVSLGQSDKTRQVIYIGKKEKIQKKEKFFNIQIRKLTEISGTSRLTELIYAQEGEFLEEEKILRLYRGYIFSRNEDNLVRIDFNHGHFDINFNFTNLKKVGIGEHDFPAFHYKKLKNAILQYSAKKNLEEERLYLKALTELYKRYALPFATLVFVIIGFPLGISHARSGKGAGLGISIVIIFLYFALYLMSEGIAVNLKLIPPFIAANLANLTTLILGIFIFYKRTQPY